MNRRGFLQGILAAAAAPAFVRSEILMPVKKIIVPEWPAGIVAMPEHVAAQGVLTLDLLLRAKAIMKEQQVPSPYYVVLHDRIIKV